MDPEALDLAIKQLVTLCVIIHPGPPTYQGTFARVLTEEIKGYTQVKRGFR